MKKEEKIYRDYKNEGNIHWVQGELLANKLIDEMERGNKIELNSLTNPEELLKLNEKLTEKLLDSHDQ